MTEFWAALGLVAPYYNLLLVVILFYLFLKLFATPAKNRKKVFQKPWTLIFVALIIFIIEELLTVLRTAGLLNIPAHINGFFELGIIILFIYALLLQKDWIKKKKL